jgi:hypothetical protein
MSVDFMAEIVYHLALSEEDVYEKDKDYMYTGACC